MWTLTSPLFEKLGFEVLTRTAHHGGSAELKLPGENQPIFEIHAVHAEEVIGINHIALRVDDASKAYEELGAAGVPFTRGPEIDRGHGPNYRRTT